MGDIASLELLSLVSKVTSEIQNHLGISEKTLAEFVIDLHSKCHSLPDFKAQMEEVGADFPQSLVESIDRLILTMHPKHKRISRGGNASTEVVGDAAGLDEVEKKSRIFKGLAMPDREQQWEDEPLEPKAKNEPQLALDDTFAMLEGLAGKGKGTQNGKRSRSPSDVDGDRNRRAKERYGSRSRSYSREEHSRPTNGYRDKDMDHRSHHRDGKRRHRGDDDDYFKRPPIPEIDDAPKLFKIYDGTVTNMQPFGAFVTLQGLKGKFDGLVHVSAMQQGARVNDPSDLVSRGQTVKVKVMSIEATSGPRGPKIGLSMKEVDQANGCDLVPQKRLASGANMERLDGMGSASNGNHRYGSLTSNVPIIEGNMDGKVRQQKKRMASPERFEIQQMINAGVVSASDYPDINPEYDATLAGDGEFEEEEDVDIEVREEEPPFLAGQTKQSLELSPIRVVKAPDGSMARAATAGESLARERREIQQQEARDKAAEQASQVDLNVQWQDPMMAPDQRKFASDLRNPQARRAPEAVPEWKRATQSKDQPLGKRTSMSIKEQRESLPVYKFRQRLIDAVKENQLMIVVGETGSGKTTQLTQYLAEAGFANHGIIGCTQPRRVAAMSVAKRVAEEVGCQLGQEVGYTIRFEDCTSPKTILKYLTDGMLLHEVVLDPNLQRYSTIILDEAHERTLATDVLFGLLKKTLKVRPDLKVIVTSATLEADKFSEYFNKCPIFTIPGRTYPVEVMYANETETDYLDAALVTVMQIHLTEPPGDILLFLTGKEEIDTSCEILYERMKALGQSVPELIILPIYAALPTEMQSKIFEPASPGSRKVVIATNIAETSITIDGIYYVVDPGYVKQNAYDPKLAMDSLLAVPISQAQAKQRAGRAGRTGPGKCFRLYTEAAYQSEMLPTSIPEIQRKNMSGTILSLKTMGINDLLGFDFMDPPSTNTMLTALEELYALSALDEEGFLTRLGRRMNDYPTEPAESKALIYSVDMGCSDEVLSIIAMLQVLPHNIFYRPKEKQQQADQKKAKFLDPHGDHLTLLNVYNGWKQSKFSSAWCSENFIQFRSLKRVEDIRKQLVNIMMRHKVQILSCGRNTNKVRQALCSGFFLNAARKDPQEGYKTLKEGTPVYLFPGSSMFQKPAEHVIYHSLVMTTKEYMQNTTAIEPKWLVEAAPRFFKVAATDRLSKRKKAERIQPLHNKFASEDDWRLSAQKRQGRGGGGGTWG
ncbi:DEAH-box ATP-dependent RNA helicase prp22 [Mycoblastus sanguinarius]|nr:DEAH-box ATP-dependent RNA helicase prp22 [Mycoblastus sanguinarius]